MTESGFYHIPEQGDLVGFETPEEALKASESGGFAWLNYVHPAKEELCALIDPLKLHPLAIEDCTNTNQVPKIEDFPGNTFIIFNAFSYGSEGLAVDEIDLFLGEKFLITVSGFASDRRPLVDSEQLVQLNIDDARRGPDFLLHIILDKVVDDKFIAIDSLEDSLDSAEERMLDNPSNFNPGEMLNLRRDMLAVRKSIFHEREILIKISRRDCQFISEKAIFHFRDIYDHLAVLFEFTEADRDILTSLMELYASLVNNLMAQAANNTNNTVRRLTFITTIFMPLTLLAGIGGMSEFTMVTGQQNWKIAYPAFCMAMVIIGLISYRLLKRVEK